MADLSAKDKEKAKFAFSIFDFDGSNTVDAHDLGDLLRALELSPTQELVTKLGGTKKKGEKMLKVDEFIPIYGEAKKSKDVGNIEDYKECLRLYDKDENGRMVFDELKHILLTLGERLDKDECEQILKECADPVDDDGFTSYMNFLEKLMAGPFPEESS